MTNLINRRDFLRTLGHAALGSTALSLMPPALAKLTPQLEQAADADPFAVPPLPYAYDALEPVIDAETLRLHHTQHHATYTRKLNDALRGTRWAEQPLEQTLANLHELPATLRQTVRENGGGHYNHSFFWRTMTPNSSREPIGTLAGAIDFSIGCYDALQAQFRRRADALFGSGWVWLVALPNRQVQVIATPNQDTPLASSEGYTPILALDVWEHAYYLNYQNERLRYIEAWWDIVDWESAEARYAATI